MVHTLEHAVHPESSGCACDMRTITECVICHRTLAPEREQVDTCSRACLSKLLNLQREGSGERLTP